MQFNSLKLNDRLVKTIEQQGYTEATPIQCKGIPAVLTGRDVMAAAQTGTGKTAAFALPLVQLLGGSSESKTPRALILTPTRELADQVYKSISPYAQVMNLRCTAVYGGMNINPQIKNLKRGIDILVATPGRLLDLYGQRAVNFANTKHLIIDEADRMLDMGFIPDIRKIIKLLPQKKQSLLFSATLSGDIRKLAESFLHNPIRIDISPKTTTAETVKQWIHPVDQKRKAALLSHLIWENKWDPVLVFTRTKHGANRLVKQLEQSQIPSLAIHGNKTQNARNRALQDFKDGKIRALVATDVAARGIDIKQLPHVVNYDLPDTPEDYVHRIGRTGRAGQEGQAISLVSLFETKQLADIQKLIKQKLERIVVETFEPTETKALVAAQQEAKKQEKIKSQQNRARNKAKKSGHKPKKTPNSIDQGTQSANAKPKRKRRKRRPKPT